MRFKFEGDQEYQLRAVESVTRLLEGQSHVEVEPNFVDGALFAAIPNLIDLDDDRLLKNLQSVQAQNDLDEDRSLEYIEEK